MRPEIAPEPEEELSLRLSISANDRGVTQLLAAAIKHRERLEAASGAGTVQRPLPFKDT